MPTWVLSSGSLSRKQSRLAFLKDDYGSSSLLGTSPSLYPMRQSRSTGHLLISHAQSRNGNNQNNELPQVKSDSALYEMQSQRFQPKSRVIGFEIGYQRQERVDQDLGSNNDELWYGAAASTSEDISQQSRSSGDPLPRSIRLIRYFAAQQKRKLAQDQMLNMLIDGLIKWTFFEKFYSMPQIPSVDEEQSYVRRNNYLKVLQSIKVRKRFIMRRASRWLKSSSVPMAKKKQDEFLSELSLNLSVQSQDDGNSLSSSDFPPPLVITEPTADFKETISIEDGDLRPQKEVAFWLIEMSFLEGGFQIPGLSNAVQSLHTLGRIDMQLGMMEQAIRELQEKMKDEDDSVQASVLIFKEMLSSYLLLHDFYINSFVSTTFYDVNVFNLQLHLPLIEIVLDLAMAKTLLSWFDYLANKENVMTNPILKFLIPMQMNSDFAQSKGRHSLQNSHPVSGQSDEYPHLTWLSSLLNGRRKPVQQAKVFMEQSEQISTPFMSIEEITSKVHQTKDSQYDIPVAMLSGISALASMSKGVSPHLEVFMDDVVQPALTVAVAGATICVTLAKIIHHPHDIMRDNYALVVAVKAIEMAEVLKRQMLQAPLGQNDQVIEDRGLFQKVKGFDYYGDLAQRQAVDGFKRYRPRQRRQSL
ncbi:hypothetical protein MIR68_000703 [Amoeboaphelidium protococcarum]|nr:hypothetical protein MIR68_000703 [Amoeboaphelidium protococcarum]